jgi:glycosyltransferase involved in cell wall biosynthesis
MKITFLVPHPVSYRLGLFEHLAARPEVELRVLYCAPDPGTRTPSSLKDRSSRYRAIVLKGWNMGTPKFVGFPMYVNPSISRWISPVQTDVLIVAGYSYPTAMAATLLGTWRRLPWVLLSDSSSLSARQSRGISARVKRSLVMGLMHRAGAVIVPGVNHMNELVAKGIPRGKIFRYHLAADLAHWGEPRTWIGKATSVPSSDLPSQASSIVTTVGRLVPEKDVATLIRGFELFHRTHRNWWLQIVGGGPDYSRLRDLASSLGLPNVLFQGPREHDQVAEALAVSSIFALTSRSESWGVAVTEALSAGLPCVLTSRVGASELVAGTRAGRIVEEGDPDSVASALAYFADMEDIGPVRATARRIARNYSVERGIPAILRACEIAKISVH